MDMNHIQLNTANVDAAAQFYGHFFDFNVQKKHGDFVFFRCLDPTEYVVEVFWEPGPNA